MGKAAHIKETSRHDRNDPKTYTMNSPILEASGPIAIRVPRIDGSLKIEVIKLVLEIINSEL